MNTRTPIRPFKPTYVSKPLVSTDVAKIRQHYGLQCKGKSERERESIMGCSAKVRERERERGGGGRESEKKMFMLNACNHDCSSSNLVTSP